MPPEPLPPWDRKELFRERKHERSEFLRWRDSRDLNRWGNSDLRRTTGHGKQGGWNLFPEDPQHGYRSGEKALEDENFRANPRGEGRYGRNYNRENRGSYNQREWRGGHSWETNSGFSNMPVRAHDVGNNNEQKPREEVQPHFSVINGGFGNTWDQQDKANDSNGFVPGGHKCDNREEGTGLNNWKLTKWNRSGSLSSRGSGFSHLSSSKSAGGALESNKPKVELETKNTTPIRSPSGDANACMTSSAALDETTSRKKPRLGWGEGLAKYEKKRVGSPDAVCKEGASGDAEHCKSPRMMSFSDCGSPATPSSVACSSSPGLDEKSFGKAANKDNDISNVCGLSCPESQNPYDEGLSFNLENFDSGSMSNFSAVLNELLQSDDSNSMDSSFIRSTALNKVLILKGNISKILEATESEIDLLETEHKMLFPIDRGSSPSASSSLPLVDYTKSCNELGNVKNIIPRPSPLQIHSSEDAAMENSACSGDQEKNVSKYKDVDVDSPGTVTSKLVEPLSQAKIVTLDVANHAAAESRDSCFIIKKVQDSVHGSGAGKVDPLVSGEDDTKSDGEKTDPVTNANVVCPVDEMSSDSIFLANKEIAERAHGVFYKVLPRVNHKLNITSVGRASSSHHHATVRERFLMRKRFLKFKERVIILKFKAFQHLWKEDMRLLSIRKQRAKSHKKFELSLRSLHNGYQKHRSSIRSRFSSPAGSISLVPTNEVINYTSKLLSDTQVKRFRDTLKMPALILDKREKTASRFISDNGLVEDPCAVEKARAMMNPWTPEERAIFMEKFAILGKNFKKISSFLDHKTTADCVDFYYKNHKSDCFEKKKKLDINKQEKSCSSSNYLMTLGKKWDRERNVASLDILGAASVMAANADSNTRSRHGCSSRRLIMGGFGQSKASWGDDGIAERSCSFDFAGNDRETVAADVLAGICGSFSSEAMSSCITTSADPGDSYRDWKCQKIDPAIRGSFMPDVTQNADDETCSEESCGEMDSTDWTDEEKSVFIQAVSSYGRDFSKISRCVRTRSRDQCKVFYSKARKCLGLDAIHPGPVEERTSAGDDVYGSGSGSENACVAEVGACSDKSYSKMDDDLLLKPTKVIHDVSDPTMTSLSALSGSNVKSEGQVDNKETVGGLEPQESDAFRNWVSRPTAASDGDSNTVVGIDDHSELLPVNESESALVSMDSGKKDPSELGMSGAESFSVCERNGLSKDVNQVNDNGLEIKMEVDEKGIADNSCTAFCLNGNYNPSSKDGAALLTPTDSVSRDSDSTWRERTSVDFQARSSGGCRVSVYRDEFREHLTGVPFLTNDESSQVVIRDLPCQMPTQKEMMNGDLSCRNLAAAVSTLPNPDRFTSQAYYLQKCNNALKPLCSVEQRSRAHLQSLSDSEKSSRSSGGGDVKLFGKILSNPSSVQHQKKANSNEENTHKPSNNKSANLNFAASLHSPVDLNSTTVLKFDPSSYQMRSYAYWDGNRLQAAFPSIPDSAILLAKYPTAFTNFSNQTTKLDQQANSLADGRVGFGVKNMVGRVGGSSGVSDPVAALKLHFAKTEKIVGQGSSGGGVVEGKRGT